LCCISYISTVRHTLVAICVRLFPAFKVHSREQRPRFLVTLLSNSSLIPKWCLILHCSCCFPSHFQFLLHFRSYHSTLQKPEILTTSLNGLSVIVSSHQTNIHYTASSHEMTRNHVGQDEEHGKDLSKTRLKSRSKKCVY
jgi:hypothetical protein